ncbi:MAG: response regulator [Alphaproteobacteria bacterium]
MTSNSPYIIVVDDDADIRDIVQEYFSEEGFSVAEASDGDAMRSLIADRIPDVILLDLKLPGEDGLTLARELRRNYPAIGLVMISGKEDVVDRVAGLEVGADDYIVKPFHLRELLARVRSVLRRSETTQNGKPASPSKDANGNSGTVSAPRRVYRFSDWTLDGDRRVLLSGDGGPVELTSGEFDLLAAFMEHPNRVLSRDQLLEFARKRESEAFDRSIDVQIGRLRRKIERDPKRPALIKTIRNVGYMLSADVKVMTT